MKKRLVPSLRLFRKRRRKVENRARRVRRDTQRALRRRERRLVRLALEHTVILGAPKVFALLNPRSHERLARFLRELVRLTLLKRQVVCIDFSQTEKFYTDGTILFYAEVRRIIDREPGCLKCRLPRDPVARQVLAHLQFLKLMGSDRVIPSDRDDVVHWRALSGISADATKGLGEAIESLPRLRKDQLGMLFRSVTEALTNVTQHAYLEPRRDGSGISADRGWWMFVREEPRELTIMFCDLGVGVPYTVPLLEKHSSWLKSRLGSVLRAMGVDTHNDGEIIRVTVEEKRSRFQADHRGNGFANIVETIAATGNGTLRIFSNRGAYVYEREDGREKHQAYNYSESIHGTVVGWKISIPEKQI